MHDAPEWWNAKGEVEERAIEVEVEGESGVKDGVTDDEAG